MHLWKGPARRAPALCWEKRNSFRQPRCNAKAVSLEWAISPVRDCRLNFLKAGSIGYWARLCWFVAHIRSLDADAAVGVYEQRKTCSARVVAHEFAGAWTEPLVVDTRVGSQQRRQLKQAVRFDVRAIGDRNRGACA